MTDNVFYLKDKKIEHLTKNIVYADEFFKSVNDEVSNYGNAVVYINFCLDGGFLSFYDNEKESHIMLGHDYFNPIDRKKTIIQKAFNTGYTPIAKYFFKNFGEDRSNLITIVVNYQFGFYTK